MTFSRIRQGVFQIRQGVFSKEQKDIEIHFRAFSKSSCKVGQNPFSFLKKLCIFLKMPEEKKHQLLNFLHHPPPTIFPSMLVHRTEDTGSLTYDVLFREQAPIAGILRGKHIVARREIVILQKRVLPYQAVAQQDTIALNPQLLLTFPFDGLAPNGFYRSGKYQ